MLILQISQLPAWSGRWQVYFLQQKVKLLLTHFSNTLSLFSLILLYLSVPWRNTYPTSGGSCEVSVPGHKIMCTAAPQRSISSNCEHIRAVPLRHVPMRRGFGAIITTPWVGRPVQGVLNCCLPPCVLPWLSSGAWECGDFPQEPVLTVNLDNGFCGPVLRRAILGMGVPFKKKMVAGVGGEEMEEKPPSSCLPLWSYL